MTAASLPPWHVKYFGDHGILLHTHGLKMLSEIHRTPRVQSVAIRGELGWNLLPETCCTLHVEQVQHVTCVGYHFLSLATVQGDSTDRKSVVGIDQQRTKRCPSIF